MSDEMQQPESLRDMLSASVDQIEAGIPAPIEKPAGSIEAPAAPIVSHETTEQKAGRTANRLRDEAGRLLPGSKEAAAPAIPPTKLATGTEPPPVAPVAAAPIVQRSAYPSTWKKGHEQTWETLDPNFIAEIARREADYARGVSTYKSEAENARHLNEAIAPFIPNLQKYNIEPTQWIKNLGTAHERLALGNPAEKVAMGVQLIRDYGIDPQALFNAISNPNYQPPVQQQPAREQFNPQQISATVEQQVAKILTEREIQSEYQKFVTAKDDAGNPKYPHYEQVKETMAGLLQAELAQDYQSAYEAALRHPRHADIYNAMQEQQRAQDEAARLAKSQAAVTHKRSQAVSVKSSTPVATSPLNGKTSLRDQLSAVADEVFSSRV